MLNDALTMRDVSPGFEARMNHLLDRWKADPMGHEAIRDASTQDRNFAALLNVRPQYMTEVSNVQLTNLRDEAAIRYAPEAVKKGEAAATLRDMAVAQEQTMRSVSASFGNKTVAELARASAVDINE